MQDRNFAILTGWSNPLLNLIYWYIVLPRLDGSIRPEVQRQVYAKGEQLPPPYFEVFPEWRPISKTDASNDKAKTDVRMKTETAFQGHQRFHGLSREHVRGIVHAFESEFTAGYNRFAEQTRKLPYLETIRRNPVSPIVLLAEFYYMGSVTMTQGAPSLARLALAICGGIYAASLASGLVHLLLDNVRLEMVSVKERTWMEFAAFGFQHHHAVQTNWSEQDVLGQGVLTIGALGVTIGFVWFILIEQVGYMSAELGCAILTYAIVILNTQVIHAFAHNSFRKTHPLCHAVYLQLARVGLVLDSKHHHIHHTRFDCNFCITNHWADPIVNWIFRQLLKRGCISKDVHPQVQRDVYIHKKSELRRPYFQMFPDWRFLQSLGLTKG